MRWEKIWTKVGDLRRTTYDLQFRFAQNVFFAKSRRSEDSLTEKSRENTAVQEKNAKTGQSLFADKSFYLSAITRRGRDLTK